MKLTLLELVQDMLNVVDSEAVTSVGETEESEMCVSIANRAFEEIATKFKWRHFKSYERLQTTANKNEMITPDGTIALDPDNLYYDGQKVFYKTPEEFLRLTIGRDVSEANIISINNVKVYTDRNPIWFTSDDDTVLRFDAIPSAIDGLAGSDTLGIMFRIPTSRLTADGDYFDLPSNMYPALNMLCQAYAIAELKGDSQEASVRRREYKGLISGLVRNSRLIDIRDDRRNWIVPRRGSGIMYTTGTGFITP